MEELSQCPLQIQGHIPGWLVGSLVRNGPVYESVNGKQIFHWFDGLAMLHAFHFQQGEVTYTNRYLRSDAYKTVFKEHSLNYLGFATDPCRSLFKKFFTHFFPGKPPIQNANINVAQIQKEYVALFETPLPVRFDPITLETLGVFNFKDDLPYDECWISAHPHNELNYLVEFGKKSTYTLYKMSGSYRKTVGKIPVDKPSYMHSFAKTDHFAIFAEYPLRVDPLKLMTSGKPFIFNYDWNGRESTKFLVVNQHTGQLVQTFESDSFFAFHHANAFEEGDLIHLDLVCYKDSNIMMGVKNYFRPQEPFSDTSLYPSELKRFTLNRKTGSCISMTLLNKKCEFPRINPFYDGKQYRYLYLSNSADNHSGEGPRPIYKLDLETLETMEWKEEGCYPGEPVFIAASNPQSEDHGVILTVVNNLKKMESFLLIIDGKTFKEIGRAITPQMVPAGLHGDFYKD